MPIKVLLPRRRQRVKKAVAEKTSAIESKLEAALLCHIRAYQLPEPEREYRFHSTRRWRFDFAWPEVKLAVECEGGVYAGGRHTRGKGFVADCEKYNTAVLQGWHVLRFPGEMITSGMAIQVVRRFFEENKSNKQR